MALDVLITGRMVKPAQQRTAANGNAFALAQVSVPTDGDESLLASCIAFSRSAVDGLLALDKGDAVALAGKAKLSTWTGSDGATKVGLNVTVDAVLTAYHVQRKRKAAQGDDREPDEATPVRAPDRAAAARPASRRPVPAGAGIADMPDDMPF
jgi:single-stranded DNA-binding protein